MKDLLGRLAAQLGLHRKQVERTASLFDEGGTVPFVARYRKEITGGLDEIELVAFRDKLNALRKLEDRQQAILKSIEDQGLLTDELAHSIEEAESLQQVEDLYLPYKPRRRTRAQVARERGLEPIAEWIVRQEIFDISRDEAVAAYLSDDVPTSEDAWQGGRDIVAERISDDAHVREVLRQITWQAGELRSSVVDSENDPKRVYETYHAFSGRLKSLRPHQVLALNRAETDKILRVNVDAPSDSIHDALLRLVPADRRSPLANDLEMASQDAYARLIGPAIEREIRRDLTQWADDHAINVFSTNLRNLLLTPPIRDSIVLGIDPGFRSGCKVAVVDHTGKLTAYDTIYPHEPQTDRSGALDTLHQMIEQHGVTLIAIGNGTASRETEEFVVQLISEVGSDSLQYLIVSEAGASVYSASPLARAELPELDVSIRGAVSIARRVQDPLAELVKIDPRSIGVGMYQHDVNQQQLGDALTWVTESVVNAVGVNVNTASPALLQYVAGLGPKLAERIVEFRDKEGRFKSRRELEAIKGMGEKTFEQAAGFLRIPDGANPIDNTGVHPESYPVVDALLNTLQLAITDPDLPSRIERVQPALDLERLASQLGIGEPTLRDILLELQRPGRDPRDDIPPPVLRADILRMEDLHPGLKLQGTVRNVVDFGAFVDIGLKTDGLVHISQMAERRVESPYEVVGVGDVIEVTVLTIDAERGRIGLSMKS